MIGSKLGEIRRSLESSGMIKGSQTQDKIVSRRDSQQVNYQEYGLNV